MIAVKPAEDGAREYAATALKLRVLRGICGHGEMRSRGIVVVSGQGQSQTKSSAHRAA